MIAEKIKTRTTDFARTRKSFFAQSFIGFNAFARCGARGMHRLPNV
jgi:hypothetical protein